MICSKLLGPDKNGCSEISLFQVFEKKSFHHSWIMTCFYMICDLIYCNVFPLGKTYYTWWSAESCICDVGSPSGLCSL